MEDVCKRVEYGNISITELRKIENRKGQMNKLCEAAVFECDASVLPVDKFNEKFKQRFAEYDHFERYRKELKLLLECLSTVNVQGEKYFNKTCFAYPCMITIFFPIKVLKSCVKL